MCRARDRTSADRGLAVTRTYALLEVSPELFAEARVKLEDAGYDHAIDRHDDRVVIDMHGLALVARHPADVPGRDADAWRAIREEIGLGITAVPDEDGKLRDRCVDLLDRHARLLAELCAVLDERATDELPAQFIKLRRAAHAVVGRTPV
jgi:hypothetical protein